jgi:hypothetical protein
MSKEKIELEYVINCSPKVLFNRLSTASGLCEWFADDVSVNGKKFTFSWDNTESFAQLTSQKENVFAHFDWIEDDNYFEFRITRDELTNDVSLLIVDFAEKEDIKETRDLWDSQILKLKQTLGS